MRIEDLTPEEIVECFIIPASFDFSKKTKDDDKDLALMWEMRQKHWAEMSDDVKAQLNELQRKFIEEDQMRYQKRAAVKS